MARAHAKVEQGLETAKLLIQVGMQLFSEHGFYGVAAEKIAENAGLTRGALYHHFGGKVGLFEAVFVDCEQEIESRIKIAAQQHEAPVEQLIAGSLAFLEACADPALRRIVVDDAPNVLGWSRWREIDAAHGLSLLRESIQLLNREGKLKGYRVDALVYLLSGAMNELAMWVAESGNRIKDLNAAKQNINALVRSITA